MMRAMSSGVAGLKAHQTALDVIGNNVANVNTYGFKSSRALFSDVLYQTLTDATAPNTTNGTGGVNPSQVGYGSTASSVSVDTGRAGMSTTGYSGDCYINGEGYFVVRDGASGYKYTRVGALSFDSSGDLVDGNGNLVLGAQDKTFASGDPDTITCGTSKSYSSISIAADGTITGIDSSSGDPVVIGGIALAHFVNPAGLEQEGGNYYKATKNSGDAAYAVPGGGATGKLVTGALESSNVDLANEFSNMITTERGYQANSKIITVADTMLETLVNMVR
ncbi:flagellar hook-basal body complex protein [Caproiciproducens sp. NJN-50]|uniref:flagellar hook-basal body complex protein n=1 Tax=Acutalibacteraceae TaxID=3082771 RepID=UPI000FFE1050|nr:MULTISPECIES: flagellar hook-basal body complex protein [Acutalibacteraceae]QAT50685.1 flagellar hook-basal body complex protein [Caproiciproducens sp. NJN-50]